MFWAASYLLVSQIEGQVDNKWEYEEIGVNTEKGVGNIIMV